MLRPECWCAGVSRTYITESNQGYRLRNTLLHVDLAWPEAFRALFHQGVELAIVPTYWTADDLTDEGKLYDPE